MNGYIEVVTEVCTYFIKDIQYQLNLQPENLVPRLLSARDNGSEASLSLIIYSCVKPIFKIYLIIGTGFLLSKVNILDGTGIKIISKIVLAVLLPCLSFNKIVVNIADSMIKEVGIVVLSSVVLFALGAAFGTAAGIFFKVPKKWRYGCICASMFPNISDLPIAYLQNMQSVFTEEQINQGVSFVIIFLVAFLLSVFNLGGFKLVEYDFLQANKLVNQDLEGGERNSNVDENYEMTTSQATTLGDTKGSSNSEATEEGGENASEITSLNTSDSNAVIAEGNDSAQLGNGNTNTMAKSTLSHRRNSSLSSPQPQMYRDNHDLSLALKGTSRRLSTVSHQASIQSQIVTLQKNKSLVQDFANKDKEGNVIPDDPVLRFIKYNSKKLNNDVELENLEQWASFHNKDVEELHGENAASELGNTNRINPVDVLSSLQDEMSYVEPEETTASRIARMVTTDTNITSKDIDDAGKGFIPASVRNLPGMKFVIFFIENCIRPCPLSVILGLIIAFIPWVKALFVSTNVSMTNAPDNLPPLSFIMDFTSYVGAASVPFGLLLLGATLGNLKIKKIPKGFWKAIVFLLIARQVVMPVIGVLWCNRLVEAGWLDPEKDMNKVLLFVICVDFGLPSMTTMIYLTSGYTPIDSDDTIQMDCVSLFLMVQYPLLIINLPFACSYYLKVQLNL